MLYLTIKTTMHSIFCAARRRTPKTSPRHALLLIHSGVSLILLLSSLPTARAFPAQLRRPLVPCMSICKSPIASSRLRYTYDGRDESSSTRSSSLQSTSDKAPSVSFTTVTSSSNLDKALDSTASLVTGKDLNGDDDGGSSKTTKALLTSKTSTMMHLFRMTRPTSTPGIMAFYLIGTYLATSGAARAKYWSIVLTSPSLWATLGALILVSAGSMVVNDCEDVRLGRDVVATALDDEDRTINEFSNPYLDTKPLVNHSLSLTTARRFLWALYAATALVATIVPGHWTRLAIVWGVGLTHLYTQFLKPVTWVKNIVCALVIAMGPVTSGLAMWELQRKVARNSVSNSLLFPLGPLTSFLSSHFDLVRVAAVIFFGVMSREVMMDCNDVLADRQAKVRTVPVVYGRQFASRVALLWSAIMATSVMIGPVKEIMVAVTDGGAPMNLLRVISIATVRRLGLAMIASGMFLRRSWHVFATRGEDMQVVDAAVNEGLQTVLVGLASFV